MLSSCDNCGKERNGCFSVKGLIALRFCSEECAKEAYEKEFKKRKANLSLKKDHAHFDPAEWGYAELP